MAKFGQMRNVRRSGRMRTAATLGALALMGTVLQGCGQTAKTSNVEPVALTVANNFAPTGVVLPLYAADVLGYFKDEGLDVKIDALKSSQDALNAVDAGRADVAVTSAILSIANQQKNLKTVAIGNSIGRHSYGFMVDKKLGVRSLKDLEGKTVLATAGFIVDEAKAVLKEQGVDPQKITFATVSPAAILNTFVGGQGDAWLTSVPLGEAAVAKDRPSNQFLLSDYGVSIPDYTYAVAPGKVNSDKAKFKAFLTAVYRGQEAAIKDPDGVAKKVAEKVPGLKAETVAAQWKSTMPFLCSANASAGSSQAFQVAGDWNLASKLLADIGFTKGKVDVEKMYTNDFAGTAVASCPIKVP
ncbi:ABC transporter substrate-binding protein [Specibacter sp. RAF43]|uniref:ABC transporter substrate-binding protein n=1 Tax=Specibacter sp. RAF43 TaxID=3233057 RepID=UPI003F9C480F